MGFWSFYFLTKVYLFERGYIGLDLFLNGFFLIFLLVRIPENFRTYRLATVSKAAIASVLAFFLLWHDSWLPSFSKSIYFIRNGGLPSRDYLISFFSGFFNPFEWFVVFLIFIMTFIAIQKKIRLTILVLLFLFLVAVQEGHQPKGELDRDVQKFFKKEEKRKIVFDSFNQINADFDIYFLHVCSISWDDLKAVGLKNDPFFQQFDYLFNRFNTVTSYSAPSAIRLLRAPCGQRRDKALYQPDQSDCYLVKVLEEENFKPFFLLNHDGIYASFNFDLQHFAFLSNPILPDRSPVQAHNFDGSLIYDDYAVLDNGLRIRNESNVRRAFFYYNTISLHDGARWYRQSNLDKTDRKELYRSFVVKLFKDLTHFFQDIASSGRKAVVIFVPEHGMALVGSNLQLAGLREIPLPKITIVPVGIKLINNKVKEKKPLSQQIISNPTSYLSLAYILSQYLKRSPFEPDAEGISDWVKDVPQTDFLSENDEALLFEKSEGLFLYGKDKSWKKLLPEVMN